jgi:DNA-binding LytR/AlgR family response regulator
VEAFEVDAVDYICKPVKKERLQKAIEKVKVISFTPNIKNEYIKVNTEKGKALLYFESLSFISVSEVDSRDKVAYLSNGNQVKLKNISFHKLLQQLPERQFCQVNKKEIIAMNIVKYYSYDLIESNYVLEGKAKSFTIGNNFREQFLRYI